MEYEYLKYQVRNIPIKLLVATLVPGYLAVNSTSHLSETIVTAIVMGIVLYGLMSCLSAFSKATGSWLLGLILFGVIVAILISQKLPRIINILVILVMLFGGVIRDIYRCIRLFKVMLSKKKDENPDNSKLHEEYIKKHEKKIQMEQQHQSGNYGYEKPPERAASSTTLEYFKDCDSKESITKRYRDLCKVYHPDMGNGSSEIFNKIQNEYNKIRKKYE